MVHAAYKVPHLCRWKFRCSSRQIILLDCIVWVITKKNTQISEGRLTVSNRQVSCWSYSEYVIYCDVLKENMTGIQELVRNTFFKACRRVSGEIIH